MPCHPDRVRRNYEAGRAAAAASWQRPSDIAAEQLKRRSGSEEHDAHLPPIRIIREGATHAAPFTPVHPDYLIGKMYTVDEARALLLGLDEPDEDCLWGV